MLTHDEIIALATEAAVKAVATVLSAQESKSDPNQDKGSAPTNTTTTKEIHVTTDMLHEYSPTTIDKEIDRRKLPKGDPKRAAGRKLTGRLVNLSGVQLNELKGGATVTYVAKGSGNVHTLRMITAPRPMPKATKAKRDKASAPTTKSTSKVDKAIAAITGDTERVWTPATLAEATGLSEREARTQLNNLCGDKCTARHMGKVMRVAPGRYVAA